MVQELSRLPYLRQQVGRPLVPCAVVGFSPRAHVETKREVEVITDGTRNQKRLLLHVRDTRPESWQIEAGTNYIAAGPNGDLTLRAGGVIRLGDGFSVGVDGKLTLELDPSLLP